MYYSYQVDRLNDLLETLDNSLMHLTFKSKYIQDLMKEKEISFNNLQL